jgi:hypothetical protein
MKKRLLFPLFAIGVTLTLCALLLLIVFIDNDCTWDADFVPEVPIFEGSTLVDSSSWVLSVRGENSYTYQTAATIAEVSAFYEEYGDCQPWIEGGQSCMGTAAPFGRYFVFIRSGDVDQPSTTEYRVDLTWDICSNG